MVFRPRVISQPRTDLPRVIAFDEMCCVVACPDRTSDDDQSVIDQAIHERGVVTPPILLANLTGIVPRRAVDQRAQEEAHETKLGDPSVRSLGRCPLPGHPEAHRVLAARALGLWWTRDVLGSGTVDEHTFIGCRSCVHIPFTPGWFSLPVLVCETRPARSIGAEANVRAAD